MTKKAFIQGCKLVFSLGFLIWAVCFVLESQEKMGMGTRFSGRPHPHLSERCEAMLADIDRLCGPYLEWGRPECLRASIDGFECLGKDMKRTLAKLTPPSSAAAHTQHDMDR